MAEGAVAVYIRLSMADGDTGRGKDESNSIVNQRSLIHSFLDRDKELSGLPRTEFVDDGYSGTNADRPSYQRMMEEIRDGRFSVCISKDFSRVFRDYIEMGDCIECLFPIMNVRYISINDGYDSRDYKGTTGGMDVVMRNIVYASYSRDLSVKESSGKRQSARKGRRATGLPGYGYMPNPANTGMDIVDPDTAPVVRRIFEQALQGINPGKIARGLNEDGIMNPSAYFRLKHPETRKFSRYSSNSAWTGNGVLNILDRYTYTGASVNGKAGVAAPCSKKRKTKDRKDWIIVEGMHEAIVTEEEFRRAQDIIHKGSRPIPHGDSYPLKSLVTCGNCGRTMIHANKNVIFLCPYRYNVRDSGCKKIRSPEESVLEKIVFNAIMDYMKLIKKKERGLKQRAKRDTKSRQVISGTIAMLEAEAETVRRDKLRSYEKYCSGILDRDQFMQQKKCLDEKLSECENSIKQAQEEMNGLAYLRQGVYSEAEAACKAYETEKRLTYDMAHAFIEKVIIHPEDQIEIKWRFKDVFADNSETDI